MASLKSIRKRISSVKNTQKITKAMKMVSAAKLRRAQEAAQAARGYADKLTALLQNVAARVEDQSHPLLQARAEERIVDVLLVTADRGLCGGYNSNLIRKMETVLHERGVDRVRLTFVGRRGFDHFKRRQVQIDGCRSDPEPGPAARGGAGASARLERAAMAAVAVAGAAGVGVGVAVGVAVGSGGGADSSSEALSIQAVACPVDDSSTSKITLVAPAGASTATATGSNDAVAMSLVSHSSRRTSPSPFSNESWSVTWTLPSAANWTVAA